MAYDNNYTNIITQSVVFMYNLDDGMLNISEWSGGEDYIRVPNVMHESC